MTKNRGKKLLSLLMTTVLSASMLTAVGSPVSQVRAAEGDKQVAGLGTSAINAPEPGEAAKAWTGSYVWYGAYDGNPVRYRVLDPNTTDYSGTTLLLDCDSILYKTEFDADANANTGTSKPNEWAYSDVKNSLNGTDFLNKSGSFTGIEKASIAESTVGTHDITLGSPVNKYFPKYTALDKDKIFLLDFEDTLNTSYGYSSDCGWDAELGYLTVTNHIKKSGSEAASWWLRSPYDTYDYVAGYVYSVGNLSYYHVNSSLGVSPAFNVNLESVIFSSVIPGTAGEKHADYKLTLLDTDMTAAVQTGKKVEAKDNKVTVPYAISGANYTHATQASVLILDKEYQKANANDAKILYYGKLDVEGSFSPEKGEGTFDFPSELDKGKWGTDYQVYLLAEDVNGEKETDYSSAPVKLDKPEGFVSTEYTVTVTNDGNGTATASATKGTEGTEVTLTATPKSGYQFKEWQVISGGVTVSDNKFKIGKSNVEIKAVFELIPIPSCTVSFDANGGSGTMYKVIIDKDSEFTLPACTFTAPEGKEFDKWDKGAAGSVIKVSDDTIIKAIWKDKAVTSKPEPTSSPEPTPTTDITRDTNDISPSNPVKVDEIEKTILNIKDDKDTKGSTYTLLKAKGTPKSKKSIKLSWSKVPGAEEYIIYGNKCGKKNKYQKIATVKGTSYSVKKLKKGTYYKYTIVAVKGDEAIATSKTIHVVTDGGKKGNNTKVKLSKTKLSLNAGKSKKIKATLKFKKKVAAHRKVAWESDNVSIATVKNGKITAVGKGTCYVYAYAQNGVSAKIKVTVK